MTRRSYATVWLVSLLSLLPLHIGCSVDRVPIDEVDSQSPTDGPRSGDMSIPPPVCKGRFCDVPKCPSGTTTEVVGKLYAGNGKDPIPGAAVFVPVDNLPEFPPGLGCDLCNDTPPAVTQAITNFDGSFRLKGTPAGKFPLVARLGRFQRVVAMESVACVENTVPADPGTGTGIVRLPKKNRELSPQDYIPRIAVVSGDYDQIECVLKRIGIDELDMYNGRAVGSRNPPAIAELGALLADETKLLSYNIVVVNCTDNQYQGLLATPQVKKNLEKFVRSGGRLYVTDWAYDVIEQVPEFAPYLCFEPQSLPGPAMCLAAPEKPTAADSRSYYGGQYRVLDKEMVKWLEQMPGVINRNAQVAVDYSFVVVSKASDDPKTQTKVWVDGPASSYGNRPQTVTFDYNSCGRVHFSTYNTEPDGVVSEGSRWPSSCKSNFSPQERLLEYLFFNIASCVQGPG